MKARKVNFLPVILLEYSFSYYWAFSRLAWSASEAKSLKSWKNSEVWPMNSPSLVRALTAPIAIPCVSVGRMIEQSGKLRLRNGHGSGMIRLALHVETKIGQL
jgi:hypothetical protein